MAEIINFPGHDPDLGRELTSAEYLQHVLKADLACCVVVGITKDDQPYIGSTTGNIGQVLYMMERGKRALMEMVEETRRPE